LVDGYRGEDETDVHECRSCDIAYGREEEERLMDASHGEVTGRNMRFVVRRGLLECVFCVADVVVGAFFVLREWRVY
jgi:hypothetical protein